MIDKDYTSCKCGCGQTIPRYQKRDGRITERKYAHGHNRKKADVPILCDYCGKNTKKCQYQFKKMTHHFCSRKCSGLFSRNKISVTCEKCKKPFEIIMARYKISKTKKFHCSFECAKRQVKMPCAFCGEIVERGRTTVKENVFCKRECQTLYISKNIIGKNHPSWEGGITKYRGHNWKGIRKEILKRDGFQCVLCFSEKRLCVHHIIPIRLFDNPIEGNTFDNLVTLCQYCHMKAEPRKGKVNPLNEKLKILIKANPLQAAFRFRS